MAITLHSLVPDPKVLLALQPEELAGFVLQYLNEAGPNSGDLNRHTFGLPHIGQDYPPEHRHHIS